MSTSVTPIAPALEVACASEIAWSEYADVVVVGWGAAGACAAIEARDGGASAWMRRAWPRASRA